MEYALKMQLLLTVPQVVRILWFRTQRVTVLVMFRLATMITRCVLQVAWFVRVASTKLLQNVSRVSRHVIPAARKRTAVLV